MFQVLQSQSALNANFAVFIKCLLDEKQELLQLALLGSTGYNLWGLLVASFVNWQQNGETAGDQTHLPQVTPHSLFS